MSSRFTDQTVAARRRFLAATAGWAGGPCIAPGVSAMAQATEPATAAASSAPARATPIRAAADRYFRGTLDIFPFWASALGLATEAQASAIEMDIAPSGRERLRRLCRQATGDLGRIDRDRLTESDRITFDTLDFRARDTLSQLEFPDHLQPINQMLYGGLFTLASAVQNGLPFATVRDHRHHLDRLRKTPEWCDQVVSNLREGVRQGVVLPRVLIERMLPMVRKLLDASPDINPLCAPARLIPAEASGADKASLRAAYVDVLRNRLIPATAGLLHVLEVDYLPNGRSTDGIGALPRGPAWYAQCARSATTTESSPDEIHATGLSEVQRLRGELTALQKSQGFDGTLAAYLRWNADRPETRPFTSDAEVLAVFRRLNDRIGPELPRLFGRVPKAPLDIRLEPELTRDTASDHYMPPSADGSRPGVYFAVVPDPRQYRTTAMTSLFLHEGRPGHHYQIALSQELPLTDMQRYGSDNAYVEGWGLYAETLGYQLGVYDDIDSRIGQLTNAMLRAVRLVVDTGVHVGGWSRQRAIDYLMAETGATERDSRAQIERYMVWPGQALGYATGRLTIERLRDRSSATLGSRFSLSDFHDQVLDQGSMPLDVLDAKIGRWESSEKAKNT